MDNWRLVFTSTQWASFNPVLEPNQVGSESDTGRFKVGDGATRWSALSYGEGGGGGSAGAPIVRKFPFAHDTPGLLTGAALYTPTIGDILIDAWIEIDTAWDGTTPKGDVGTFVAGNSLGWWAYNPGRPFSLTVADANVWSPTGPLGSFAGGTHTPVEPPLGLFAAVLWSFLPGYESSNPSPITRDLPAKFLTADPVKVVVSQDGTNTGADPGSTQGAAILYLVTATPI
jgi:hypothetical protein